MTEIQLVKTAQGHFIALDDNEVGAGEIVVAKYSASKQRTLQQNAAMHKYFELLAKAFNDAGYTVHKVLTKPLEISWSKDLVKYILWHTVQSALFGKKSTKNLDIKEVSQVYEEINNHTSSKLGVHVPFPDKENLGKYCG
jgi:hypothetical protein